ncbi:MAG: FAD:protein FMN transferase [Phycisphaerae bacterium]|nr:FAD:protein FMN transferase [Phycisphaerae bacterium]
MIKTGQKILLIISAVAIIVLLLIFRTGKAPLVRADSANVVVMNTIAKIIAVAPDEQTAQNAIEAAIKKIKHLENLFNRYDPNSQLSLVNRQADKEPVKIDKELFVILQRSIYYSKLTDGAFDITVGPLVDLWKKCAEANSMPTDEPLAQVKKRIGYDKILLDANQFTVRFAAEAMSLDLGAIAKGFVADRAIEEMKKAGALGGLVDLGGQIGCFGLTEKNGKWVIGVQNPSKLEAGQTILKLALSDSAAATSGDYRRHYKIGNKQFSHIFNPATEKSADTLSSVTIITSSGTAADALATAVSVMGAERGIELIEKLPNTEAIIIKSGNEEMLETSKAERFILR